MSELLGLGFLVFILWLIASAGKWHEHRRKEKHGRRPIHKVASTDPNRGAKVVVLTVLVWVLLPLALIWWMT